MTSVLIAEKLKKVEKVKKADELAIGVPRAALSWENAWKRVQIYKGLFADTMPP